MVNAPKDRGHLFALLISTALVTLLAIGLRFYRADDSFWLDELHTSWTIQAGFSEIPPRAAMGNTSPFYFYLPWMSSQLFGHSEWTVRLPSIAAGVALVPLVVIVVWRWTYDNGASLLVGLIVAIDPLFVEFSQEARAYAMVQMVGLFHMFLFWSIVTAPTRAGRCAWIAGTVILYYLHYTALMVLAAQCVMYAILYWRQPDVRRYSPVQLIIDVAVIALSCMPSLRHLADVAARHDNWSLFIDRPTLRDLVTLFSLPCYAMIPAGILGAMALARPITRNMRQYKPWNQSVVLLLICWFAVPVGLAWILSYTDVVRIFFPRYLIIAALSPVLMSGLLCARCTTRWGQSVFITTLTGWVLLTSGPVGQLLREGDLLHHGAEDWKGAVNFVNESRHSHSLPLFVRSGLIEANELTNDNSSQLRQFCLLPVFSLYRIKPMDRVVEPLTTSHSGRLTLHQLQLLRDSGGAWLIVRGDNSALDTTVTNVRRQFPDGTCRVEQHQAFSGVQVVRLTVRVKC